ncbi:MAG TPA: MBL fold metallo-hydrolase [Bryobacteraceae bacterium]|nr:MBL fold metallo-hydrolase [Bryobacteraceae bacterium]
MLSPKSLVSGFVLLSSLSAFAPFAAAQSPAAAPFVTHSIKDNVSYVEGGGGNSGVIVGKKGVIVIDAKTTPAGGKELIGDIAKLTPEPVTTVILTHSDGDHVNGLAAFPMGISIVAQQNDKKEQDAALAAGGRGAPPADHPPNKLISKNDDRLKVDGVTIELLHWAPAHTSGDLVVFLPKQKIVFTGDIITSRQEPLIHLEKNGSTAGWVETAKGIIALDADVFIPGHGDPMTKADVQKKLSDAEAKLAKTKDLIAQGKSLEEVKTAVGDPAPVAGRPGFASFAEVIYREQTKK